MSHSLLNSLDHHFQMDSKKANLRERELFYEDEDHRIAHGVTSSHHGLKRNQTVSLVRLITSIREICHQLDTEYHV